MVKRLDAGHEPKALKAPVAGFLLFAGLKGLRLSLTLLNGSRHVPRLETSQIDNQIAFGFSLKLLPPLKLPLKTLRVSVFF